MCTLRYRCSVICISTLSPLLALHFPAHLFDAAIAIRIQLFAEVEADPVATRHAALIEAIVLLLKSIG